MDLWIRSQDKINLKQVKNIYIKKIENDFESWVGNIHCRPYVIISDNGNLGFYATKERALEVLDEIQNLLENKIDDSHINKFDIYNGQNIKIYEMPKE